MAQPTIRLVDKDATGTPIDGTTWSRAYRTLQAALDNVPLSGTTQIWVAEGTYRPSKLAVTGKPRSVTFAMKNALEIYGGFAGTEALVPISPTNDPRTPGHVTILNGDLNIDDAGDPDEVPEGGDPTRDDNAYQVVTGEFVGGTAILDGFTVTGGHAVGDDIDRDNRGGGVSLVGAQPLIRDCLFTRNYAQKEGGAVNNRATTFGTEPRASFDDCTFTFNRSDENGGAAFMHEHSHTLFTGCVFEDNQCLGQGGAVCALFTALPELTSCQFRRNSASGSTAQGGALYSNAFAGSPVENVVMEVFDCVFQENVANQGGAAFLIGSAADFLNTRFISNVASPGASNRHGGAVYNHNTRVGTFVYEVDFANCLFLANSAGGRGGAIYTIRDATLTGGCATAGCVEIYGSTFSQNVAAGKTGGVYADATTLAAYNSIFWNNDDSEPTTSIVAEQVLGENGTTVTVLSSCVQDSLALDGSVPFNASNIDADPLFLDPLGPDMTAFTGDEDLHVKLDPAVSPTADSGNNNFIPNDCLDQSTQPGCLPVPIAFDLDGNLRPANYPGQGPGAAAVDMGAYEIVCTESAACDDEIDCTDDYSCTAGGSGACAREENHAACNDGFACSIDTCSIAAGNCLHMEELGFCDDFDVCTFAFCGSVGSSGCDDERRGGYGDVNGDCTIDVFDILCVLDGFAGVFTSCSLSNVDIGDCAWDEVIDIFDINSVLDAFAQSDGTLCGCGRGPECPQSKRLLASSGGATRVSVTTGVKSFKAMAETETATESDPLTDSQTRRAKTVASDTTLSLVPRTQSVDAGETVAIDVFADDVKDLRGYQLRLTGTAAESAAGAGGGNTAAANAAVVDVFVDTGRDDFVFAGSGDDARHAVDMENHRLVAALLSGGTTRTGRVYLGTFVFKTGESAGSSPTPGGSGAPEGIQVAIHPVDGLILLDPTGAVQDIAAPTPVSVSVE